jgi:hypothetical protein
VRAFTHSRRVYLRGRVGAGRREAPCRNHKRRLGAACSLPGRRMLPRPSRPSRARVHKEPAGLAVRAARERPRSFAMRGATLPNEKSLTRGSARMRACSVANCSTGSAPVNVHGGRWWTLRGRQKVRAPPAQTTQLAAKQAETQSPLTDSNRRPPPYHFAPGEELITAMNLCVFAYGGSRGQ